MHGGQSIMTSKHDHSVDFISSPHMHKKKLVVIVIALKISAVYRLTIHTQYTEYEDIQSLDTSINHSAGSVSV